MALAQITDHVEQALALLQSALSGPVLRAVLGVFIQAVQDYEDLVFAVLQQRQFGTATGVQIDDIGQLLGLARSSDSDFAYTFHIAAAIIANTGGGTGDALLTIADRVLTGLPGSVEIQEDPELLGGDTDAVVTWATDNEADPAAVEARDVINRLLSRAVVAGVSTTKQPTIPAIRTFATLPEAIALTAPGDQFRLTQAPAPGSLDQTQTGVPGNAFALACDGEQLYVACANRVVAMPNLPGAQTPIWESRANMVESTKAKVDTDGVIVVAGELASIRTYSCFGVYDRDTGKVLFRDTTLLGSATDLCADSEGDLKRAYVASGSTIYRWQSSNPGVLEPWVSAPGGIIRAISTSSTDVWVLWNLGINSSLHRIAKTSMAWDPVSQADFNGSVPLNLSFDMEGARMRRGGSIMHKELNGLGASGGIGQWGSFAQIAGRQVLADDRFFLYAITGQTRVGDTGSGGSTAVAKGLAIDGLYRWLSDGTPTLIAQETGRDVNHVWTRAGAGPLPWASRDLVFHLAQP